MKKGEIWEGVVEKVDFPNKGILLIGQDRVIIKNVLPGQKVRFSIYKAKKGHYEGKLIEILEKSPLETEEKACKNFGFCGGCIYQTLPYQEQLKLKENQVKRLLEKIDTDFNWGKIIGSPLKWEYRNKMEFSFGNSQKDGPLTLGLHKRGSFYDILTTSDCKIVNKDFNKILACTLDYFSELGVSFYQKRTHQGYLRHLLIRRAAKTKEVLVSLITSSQEKIILQPWVNKLLELELEGKIVGILHVINDSLADVVKSDATYILYGQDYFFEEILGLKFKISTFSFFQTNSLGAEVLYQKVRDYIGDIKEKVIFDLYSGTGTIAQVLAPVAKKVIGVEIVEKAVEAARENAKLNQLENCEFIAGDVLKVIEQIEDKPDFIILDPPRDGVHPKALKKIIDYKADKIIYISCKPTSLIRDLEVLQKEGYKIKKIQCIDLFPSSVHVECVVLMSRVRKERTEKV